MNNKIIVLVAAAVIAVGGGAGVATLLRKPAAATAEKAKPELAMVELDEFLVNLADTQDQHYLKTTIALEVPKDPKVQEEITAATPQIRDAVIVSLTRRHFHDLLTNSGKLELKNSLCQSVNKVLKEGAGGQGKGESKAKDEDIVSNVYFTAFAMQ